MNKVRLLLVAMLAAPAIAPAANLPPGVVDTTGAARTEVKIIHMQDLMKVLDNPDGALVLDLREESEYASATSRVRSACRGY